jgi:uncharacterized protein
LPCTQVSAIQKPPKLYFYDNADVVLDKFGNTGPRFENLVAADLLKCLQFIEDSYGHRSELAHT